VTNEKINILYVIDSLTHGGTERQLAELIRNLDRNRFTPHLCTLKPSQGLFDELDVPKLCLNFSSFASMKIFGVEKKLSQFIHRNKIQIVQTFFQDPFPLAALIKPLNQYRLIGSFRDLGFWRTPSESRKMRFSYPFYDGFIANSEAVKESFAACDGIDGDRITVIYNGFDLSAIADTPVPTSKVPIIGIVANLNRPVKRVKDFILAAGKVHCTNPDVLFVVIGGGHLQKELQELALQSGIAGCTTFTGMISNPIQQVLGFTVGVITSETEGFCNAIIEYMACGIPVVATRTGGNVELISDGENGYLYEVGNTDELADRLLLLLADRNNCTRIGSANALKVRNQYSMGQMIEAHQKFYSSLT
jgi:glycosyltransferase involved in cell wall biosynthesis